MTWEIFNIDTDEPSDITQVIEAMLDKVREDLQEKIDELEEQLAYDKVSIKELEAEVARLSEYEWMYKDLEK